jgi:hypothetical protein
MLVKGNRRRRVMSNGSSESRSESRSMRGVLTGVRKMAGGLQVSRWRKVGINPVNLIGQCVARSSSRN